MLILIKNESNFNNLRYKNKKGHHYQPWTHLKHGKEKGDSCQPSFTPRLPNLTVSFDRQGKTY